MHLSALAVAPWMLLDSRHGCSEVCTEPSPYLGSLSDSILHEGMGLMDRLGSSVRIVADLHKKHFVHSNDVC